MSKENTNTAYSQTDVSCSEIIEFQITQSWGDGCKAWEYFEIDYRASLNEIEKKAINCIKESWRKQKEFPSFSVPEKCKKTIKISEYKDGAKVKGGISFKTKWR